MSLKDHALTSPKKRKRIDELLAVGDDDAQQLREWLDDDSISSASISRSLVAYAKASGRDDMALGSGAVAGWRRDNEAA